MSKTKWQDETGYSQGDTERIPRIWALNLKSIRLSVHRHRHYEPDQWLLSCNQLGIQYVVLDSKEIEDAKEEAIQIVIEKCNVFLKELKAEAKKG